MFYMFDVLIRPILTYGSDIWGFSSELDKVFLNYNRCTLHVKATTCNTIVNSECGKFPPSVHCHINVFTYYHRLLTMPKGKVVKSVFNTLYNLNDQGFQTWITRVCELTRRYGIDINETASIETYALYKSQYATEKYLDLISNPKYRIAVSKLRASSHNLEIERGRYTRPKINPENRLWPSCYVVDNEIHFVVRCRINETLRITWWNKINAIDSGFAYLDDKDKFCSVLDVLCEIYYHGLGNVCISHLIYVTKRYMDLPRHAQIYQPWYPVWSIYSAIVMAEKKTYELFIGRNHQIWF